MRLFVGFSVVIYLILSIAPAWSQSTECTPKIGWVHLCSKKAKGTAVVEDVLAGKTFSNSNDVEISGTMPNNGTVTIVPGASNQNIPAGYHNGSGTVTGDANLLPVNIKSGTAIFGVVGTSIESSGTATSAQVLSGQTFSNAFGPATGTMANIGWQNFTPGTSDQIVLQGYHDGTGKVAGDLALIPGNIKSGTTIFGVTGTAIEASGTASPDQVLSGQTFSSASGPATGTMANIGRQNFTPGTSDQPVHRGYHDGTGKVAGDLALIPENIKSGATIFGVTGSYLDWPKQVELWQLCIQGCYEEYMDPSIQLIGCQVGCNKFQLAIIENL